jgi:cell division protein FtsB
MLIVQVQGDRSGRTNAPTSRRGAIGPERRMIRAHGGVKRMGPEVLSLFVPIIAVGGGVFLFALKMRYNHLEETRLGGREQQEEVQRLAETVDNLRAEVGLLNDEFRSIDERMDFTERLLEGPKAEE